MIDDALLHMQKHLKETLKIINHFSTKSKSSSAFNMANRVLLVASALVSVFAIVARGDPTFNGENVCNKTIIVRRDKTVEEPIKYELQYDGICGILPCKKTKIATRIDYKLKTTMEEMNVAVCCPGYAETPDRQCAPICFKPCNNGVCVAPGLCKCNPEPTEISPGFVGSTCKRFTCLASNRWGTKCDRECNCHPNSYCSASTGKCICRTGWRGANCMDECDPSTNCEDVELPPIIEPDSNVISDSVIQSQKLEALAPRALLRELEIPEDRSPQTASSYSFDSPLFNISMNAFLLSLVVVLILAIWRIKNRINMIRNEIYYSPSSGSTPNSNYGPQSSYYTNGSSAASVQNRPRMPTPPEANFFGKNLSFDAATRYILMKGGASSQTNIPDDVKVDSRAEAHLINSQQTSKKNLYSDIDQTINKTVLDDQMLRISTSATIDPTPHYQVPKSQAIRIMPLENPSSNDDTSSQQQTSGLYENADLNVYEEIKPRSPYKEI